MYRRNTIPEKSQVHRHHRFGQMVLGCVIAAAWLFVAPGSGMTAGWLAPGADQTVAAPWVEDLAARLNEAPYHDILGNGAGEVPYSAVMHYLNGAARAIKDGNKPLAQSYIDRTLAIFDNGERRGYYGRADAEMIKKFVRTRAEAALKGEQTAAVVQDDERWSGYTKHKPLGLTNEPRD